MIRYTNLRKQLPRRILIILRLSRPQLLVNAALADKLIVRTALGNSSIVHNGYLVAEATGRQAVGDVDCGLVACNLVELSVDLGFGNRIECKYRARKSGQAPLSARQAR